jgi:hypothetical protein
MSIRSTVNTTNQETSFNSDIQSIAQAANNIVDDFGINHPIGKGYAELAKVAEETSEFFDGFFKRVEKRLAKTQ